MHKQFLILALMFIAGLGISLCVLTLLPINSKTYSLPSEAVIPSTNEVAMPVEPESLKLLFGGDLMFDRSIRSKINQFGVDHSLKELQSTFATYDLVVANLEGPITDNPSRSLNSEVGSVNNFLFTFDPAIVLMLKSSNMLLLNLGNNHITNFGVDGVLQTKQYLQQAQLEFFGNSGSETASSERVVIKELKGHIVGFVNYNEFVPKGFEAALQDIAFARSKSEIVVVYTHWGAEYAPVANAVIQDQAHQFIDTGADVVIGSHPHVVQQTEIYKDKKIYYSLGNFVFDQYFSPETQNGLLVAIEINEAGELLFSEIPIVLQPNGQTVLK